MTTFLRIDEQYTEPITNTTQRNELGRVIGEAIHNFARGRVFIEVIKRNTTGGVRTTIHVTFYDSDNKGVRASAHGTVEGANVHLHGDFDKDFTDLTVSGELTLSAD
ncbi:MAG: hypothetical protein WBP22_04555 [Candidatus Saccharimonas sp.]